MNPTTAAWLGPAIDEMDDELIERWEAEARELATWWPGRDPDYDQERQAALTALTQYLLGELTVDQAGAERMRTRTAADLALIQAKVAARLAVLDGMPKAEAARRAGIDRMVVLQMLGERQPRQPLGGGR